MQGNLGDSLSLLTSTLRKVLDERYEEEYKAAEQITDKARHGKLMLYLEARRQLEEQTISNFSSLCKRSLFGGT